MEQVSQASITLTRDELLVFLGIMGVPTMNGLPEEPLAGLSDDEIAQRYNSGELSLQNRGLAVPEGKDNVVLDDKMTALVGGSVIPEATLLVSIGGADDSVDPHYFSATPDLFIEHFCPRPGIHTFSHVPNPDSLMYRVQELLAAVHVVPEPQISMSGEIDAQTLTRVLQTCRNGKKASGKAELVKAGWPSEMVEALVQDYSEATSYLGMVMWGLRAPEPKGGDSAMAIATSNRCWLVQNIPSSTTRVTAATRSGLEAEKALEALLQPLLSAVTEPA